MPVTLKSSGGGSVTMDVPATGSTFTLTLPAANGTVLQTGTAVTVAQGGTGLATLTANNVILGNGTGTPNFVAPGSNGNVLTSNGTTWTSAAPSGGGVTSLAAGTAISVSSSTGAVTVTNTGVTSLTAGNGITVSASTGAVTVSQNIYTGTTVSNTSYPVGTYVLAGDGDGTTNAFNKTNNLWVRNDGASMLLFASSPGGSYSAVTGTWRQRGQTYANQSPCIGQMMVQRVA
jgi:hypothetical protein